VVVKKGILLGLPLVMIIPLLLLILGAGNANIEAVRAACANTATSGSSGSFGIGTLNWRGASHYTKNPYPGERPYSVRVPNMVSKIGAAGASIIGFQEFEPPQAQAFLTATDGAWKIVAGKRRGKRSTANAIAYQPGAWKLNEVRYVSIKYGGPMIQVPLARFTSTGDMASIWVLNTHNPAKSIGGTNAMRDSAVRAEAKALRQLQSSEPNTPLFLAGDMNDKARFKRLFLSSVGHGWSSANPSDKQIDWIMGGPGVSFSGTVVDRSTNDKAHDYTDHPFVHTTAQLQGSTSVGEIDGPVGGPVNGKIGVAAANIPNRSRLSGFRASMPKVLSTKPDFVALNEVSDRTLGQIEGAAPGYSAYRDTQMPSGLNRLQQNQAMSDVVMWRNDIWTKRDSGRVQIVEDDKPYYKGRAVTRATFATWALLERKSDGAVVSVITVHHQINPHKFPRQHGNPPQARRQQYGHGMDIPLKLANSLATHGPVLVAGNMNSHDEYTDMPWSPVLKMKAAGYGWYNHAVDFVFFPQYQGVKLARGWTGPMVSDHRWVAARLNMNGAGPSSGTPPGGPVGIQPGGTRPAGCPPCPTTWSGLSVALPNVTGTGSLRDAKVAATAAYQAGFRGEDLVTAVALARVESTWNPRATNGSHYGLWQIAGEHKGKVPGRNKPDDIFDPVLNAKYAYALYQARPGSGEAKFADWIPFQKEDHHKYFDIARQAVAATAGTTEISNVPATTGCEASPMTVASELSADLSERVNAMMNTPEGLCALPWSKGAPCTYDNQCPKVVDAVYGGPGVGRGYGNGQDVAQGIINAGLAQAHGTGLDPLPPVGAVVSYNTGNGVGHVAIYVGNGKIFGNDYGCSANGVYGCVGYADVRTPGGSVTWALPKQAFDMGGMPSAAA
jgi:hypothetical protein